ncbi:MAG: hypothetical protein Q9187_004771 [Circinaria calcarea]
MTEPCPSTTTSTPETPAPQPNGTDSLHALCSSLHTRVEAFLQEDVPTERLRRVQAQTRISLRVIEEALERYTHATKNPKADTPVLSPPSLPQLSFSYNGGKDCLVLLILYLASLSTHPSLSSHLQSIYIVPPHPFPEVDAFVTASSQHYRLCLARYARDSMKAAFAAYLAENPAVRAIFVGTRRTDPHGADLTFFDMTDHGWPGFMRVHPVIDWHYAEIWSFLRHLQIPYCELYDRGYTSLGGTTDTHPNPKLRSEGPEGVWYRPAYELEEDGEERLGRDR